MRACCSLQADHGKAQHFQLADQIVVLGRDGKIAQMGTYAFLRSQPGYIGGILLKLSQQQDQSMAVVSPPTRSKSIKGPCDDDMKDMTRKTGDMAVYSTYKQVARQN